MTTGLKFVVYVDSLDERYCLGACKTYEKAFIRADKWLGDNAIWEGPTRAISVHGEVLTIERSDGKPIVVVEVSADESTANYI